MPRRSASVSSAALSLMPSTSTITCALRSTSISWQYRPYSLDHRAISGHPVPVMLCATFTFWGVAVRLTFARSGCAALAGFALPMLVALAPAHAAATCARGSGPHLAGQRITAAEVARYQGTTGLRCADLARANLSGLDLIQVDLTRANLRGANLSHAKLDQATLTGAAMQGADLRKANFTQATMTRVNVTGADLRKATLDQATLTDADLTSADLAGASLIEVQANRANFRSANLSDTSFTGATLTGAHFTGANLSGANFSGATGAPARANSSGG